MLGCLFNRHRYQFRLGTRQPVDRCSLTLSGIQLGVTVRRFPLLCFFLIVRFLLTGYPALSPENRRMPIPSFNNDGIIPPFLGADPGGDPALMSPYEATAAEVVQRFNTTPERQAILSGWLQHRAGLRSVGVVSGFQWLDGSFVEDKHPKDLDVVNFVHPPASFTSPADWRALFVRHQDLFVRHLVKKKYMLDSFFINFDGDPESTVLGSRYLLQLFSHQRGTFSWKGMLQVRLEDSEDDATALQLLTPPAANTMPGQNAGGTP